MKNLFWAILLVCPLLFVSSCERIKHGCIDSNATNYTDNANIDNNTCCYDCYINGTFYGNFCGPEALEIEANGIEEYSQVYQNGLPQFYSDGQPVMSWQSIAVDCDGL